MLGVVAMASFGFVAEVFADSDCTSAPNEGKYCYHANSKPSCPAGCYCTGGSKSHVSDAKTNACNHVSNRCADRNPNCEPAYKDANIFYCPADFPYSDAGAKSMFECFNTKFGSRMYRSEYLPCDPGEYLPAGKIVCEDCKDCDGNGTCYYCPGIDDGTAVYDSGKDQGIFKCAEGTVPNSDKTKCEKADITCPAASYLPKESSINDSCKECPSGYVCLGGTYSFNRPNDQGLLLPKDACTMAHGFSDNDSFVANSYGDGCDKCPIGTKANADHTECVETSIKVTKGYYLPANSVQQQKCSNPKKFCPGGNFWKSSVEQGQYDCPFTGTSASSNYQRCTVTLSREQLQFGVMGNNGSQCWSKTDPEDFQYCVLGLRGIKTIPALSTATTFSIKEYPIEQKSAPTR